MSKSNEELQQELASLYQSIQAQKLGYSVCYWMTGIGIVLLAVGLATYGSAWGLLWMPGAVGAFSGAVGYVSERGKTSDLEAKFASVRAVIEDRRR